MKVDLHCHSNFSDGELSPCELAQYAKQAGADAFALTDHDTMCGVNEARIAARNLGLKFVAGVEISAYCGANVHVLGYNVNAADSRFVAFEKEISEKREERAVRTLAVLEKHGMSLTLGDVYKYARRNPSRAHIARALVAAGYERDIRSCFSKWLKEGAPCYIPTDFMTPEQAVSFIRALGGKAVLAHPVRLKLSEEECENLIARMSECGLDGIEASYKFSDEQTVERYRALAEKYSLFVTNGGDFHAPDRSAFVPREVGGETLSALGLK